MTVVSTSPHPESPDAARAPPTYTSPCVTGIDRLHHRGARRWRPRLRVLLAEDHPDVAEQLRRRLEIECDVVGVVTDGSDLLEAVEALAPEVIVSDVTMPAVDGLTAVGDVLRVHSDARIVFVTVHDEPGIVRRALRLGALGDVLKADACEELLIAVHAARANQRHLSTNIRARLL
jgi:DNA-binding NarL/FixJ family response regulator